MKHLSKTTLCLVFLVQTSDLFAHGELEPILGWQVDADFTASYFDQSLHDEAWLIPGTLMGGEVYGSEQGAQLDEASVGLRYGTLNNFFASLEVGSHAHGSEYDLELEQASLGQYLEWQDYEISVEAGRMKALFSPTNTQHLNATNFERQSLLYSAFVGGHYVNNGLRALIKRETSDHSSWLVGAELWDGDAFPATSSGGVNAYDLFAYYDTSGEYQGVHGKAQGWHLNIGLWHLGTQSENRKDDRFSSGHSHGGASSTLEDIRFSGDHHITGLRAALSWDFSSHITLDSTSEVIWNEGDGEVRDQTRLADLDFEHLGASQEFGIGSGQHRIGFRYEWLGLKNTLSGPGAAILAQDANLIEKDDPYRASLAYNYLHQTGLRFKVGVTTDDTDGEADSSVWISVGWTGTFRP